MQTVEQLAVRAEADAPDIAATHAAFLESWDGDLALLTDPARIKRIGDECPDRQAQFHMLPGPMPPPEVQGRIIRGGGMVDAPRGLRMLFPCYFQRWDSSNTMWKLHGATHPVFFALELLWRIGRHERDNPQVVPWVKLLSTPDRKEELGEFDMQRSLDESVIRARQTDTAKALYYRLAEGWGLWYRHEDQPVGFLPGTFLDMSFAEACVLYRAMLLMRDTTAYERHVTQYIEPGHGDSEGDYYQDKSWGNVPGDCLSFYTGEEGLRVKWDGEPPEHTEYVRNGFADMDRFRYEARYYPAWRRELRGIIATWGAQILAAEPDLREYVEAHTA